MNARKRFPFPHTQLDVFTVAVRMVKQANAVAQAIPRGHRKIAGLCDLLGEPPQQAVFDGGFSSIDNVAQIKRRGVTDVVFTKHQGIEVGDMARSAWVFKRLRRFRAGVEGVISFLKRALGIGHCLWRGGRQRFAAHTWASILSANLLTLARHQLAP